MAGLQLSGYGRHSSTVRLELRAQGQSFQLAAIGPHSIVPRDPIELEPCEGEIYMDVDGETVMWPVHMKYGAVPFAASIEIESRGDIQRPQTR
jgi:hypothetical protein